MMSASLCFVNEEREKPRTTQRHATACRYATISQRSVSRETSWLGSGVVWLLGVRGRGSRVR